jgi:hypothetical protein
VTCNRYTSTPLATTVKYGNTLWIKEMTVGIVFSKLSNPPHIILIKKNAPVTIINIISKELKGVNLAALVIAKIR